MSTCPTAIEYRIDNALDQHNRTCRREDRPGDMLPYSRQVSSSRSAFCQHVYLHNNAPDAFVLFTFHDEQDWRQLRYKILTSRVAIQEFVEPLVQQYTEEMFQYYKSIDTHV